MAILVREAGGHYTGDTGAGKVTMKGHLVSQMATKFHSKESGSVPTECLWRRRVTWPIPGPRDLEMTEVTLGKTLPGKLRTEPQVAGSFLMREAEGGVSSSVCLARAVPHSHAFPVAIRFFYFRTEVRIRLLKTTMGHF